VLEAPISLPSTIVASPKRSVRVVARDLPPNHALSRAPNSGVPETGKVGALTIGAAVALVAGVGSATSIGVSTAPLRVENTTSSDEVALPAASIANA
jgi:hypothetical protein